MIAPRPPRFARSISWWEGLVAKSTLGSASQSSRSRPCAGTVHGPPATGGGSYGGPAGQPDHQPPSVGDLWQSRGDPMSNIIDELTGATKRDDVPDFRAGDTIKVHVKVVEGNRSRVQVFQGVVLKLQGSGGAAPSRCARSPSASVSSAPSRCTRRSSRRSKSSPAVTSGVRSFITCATCAEGCQDQGAPRGLSAHPRVGG